jgi:ribosomal protein S18
VGGPATGTARWRTRRCPLGRKDSRGSGGRGGSEGGGRGQKSGRPQRKKICHFCKERIEYVDFKDLAILRKYVSDRGKIRARRVTGTCTRHQRDVATAIKNAREVALLPYVVR